MASHLDFIEYVCTQLQDIGIVTYRKMFGEYGIYINGKIVALVCDDQLYIKPTKQGRKELREIIEMPPYQGAKPYFLIEDVEDRALLTRLFQATYAALPEPKHKGKTISNQSLFSNGSRAVVKTTAKHWLQIAKAASRRRN